MSSINFPIRMYDPTRDYQKYKTKYQNEVIKVMEKGNFINGDQVKTLEKRLADYVGVNHCICVGNGTDALQIALMGLDIKAGDEVITVPHTWISTSEVISLLGAKPVFVDIESDTFNIDVSKIESKITEKTKAILPVSLYGHMPNYEKINEIASKYNIPVIEDGAQSFGAIQNSVKSCGATLIGCTSFFPSKPLGCYGDGGAIFTNDENIALKVRAIKSHGGIKRFHHEYIGVNSRLDTIQAAVLNVKLDNFENSISSRSNIANNYIKNLNKCTMLKLPLIKSGNRHVWAQFSILAPNKIIRDKIVEELKNNNIHVSIFYPVPLHFQNCFKSIGYKNGDFPVCEDICNRIFNLPCYAELSEIEQKYILEQLINICNKL